MLLNTADCPLDATFIDGACSTNRGAVLGTPSSSDLNSILQPAYRLDEIL